MSIFSKTLLTSCLTLALTACGDSDSDEDKTSAKFSLGVSDAPVDEAQAVYIEIDSISLSQTFSEDSPAQVTIDTFASDDRGQLETIQVNLLDFQGSSQLKIVDEAQGVELENGIYNMELNVIDSGSYVMFDGDERQHDIKIPSSRLRLGEFTVTEQAVQVNDSPAYTIEFDLRQSLVQRGNANNNNGYIIKPHGVRIVSLAGNIEGTVSSDLTNLGKCTAYLYEGTVTEFADMFDADDESFVTPAEEITGTAPLATATVNTEGNFSIGFVQAGDYQLALTCGTEVDDNIQYDGLTIPSAADMTPEAQTIQVNSQQTTSVTFE